MADISQMEHRLTEALERMRRAHLDTRQALGAALGRLAELDAMPPMAGPDVASADAMAQAEAEIARLTAALNAERAQGEAIAQAAEADRAALDDARQQAEGLRAAARLAQVKSSDTEAETAARLTALESGMDQLRKVNAQLRENNAALRKAHEQRLSDPDLVNAALRTEIEALTAARAADRAEIDGILSALKPLVEETEDA